MFLDLLDGNKKYKKKSRPLKNIPENYGPAHFP
jgi:hypothetical protein